MRCPSCRALNADSADVCVACGEALHLLVHGTVLARRYQVVAPLGSGGMGVVYQAHDLQLDEKVALKVLRADLSSQSARRFISEIRLARKVRHRNVCAIHEYHEEGALRFIAMELIEGVDLRRILKERGALPPREAYDVAVQTALGLEAIHEVGIVHRDLKTANLMRDARGVVRLMDFGIAKELGNRAAINLTAAGQIVGTPEYMSPEQAQGQTVDGRSDIYALGIVVFELFTGAVPFHGPTPVSTLFKHVREPPPLDGSRGAGIPPELSPVLHKALAKKPAERFATAREMADALETARRVSAEASRSRDEAARAVSETATWPAKSRAPESPLGTTAVPETTETHTQVATPTRRRRLHPLALWLAAVALVVGGSIGFVSLRLTTPATRPSSPPPLAPPTTDLTTAPPSAAVSPPTTVPSSVAAASPHVVSRTPPPTAEPRDTAVAVFVPDRTSFTPPASVKARGFRETPQLEIRPAQAPAARAQLVIEVTPSVIRPGDGYLVRYSLFNTSAAPLSIGAVSLRQTAADGAPSGGVIEPLSRSARPQSRTLLCEQDGTWGHGDPASWATTLTVVLDDGSIYESTLRARRQ